MQTITNRSIFRSEDPGGYWRKRCRQGRRREERLLKETITEP